MMYHFLLYLTNSPLLEPAANGRGLPKRYPVIITGGQAADTHCYSMFSYYYYYSAMEPIERFGKQ